MASLNIKCNRYASRCLLSLSLFLGTANVYATVPISNDSIFNKIKFYDWLVNSSPTVNRIIQSADEDAIDQLHDARQRLSEARELYQDGELDQADEQIAIGLQQMTGISRKIKDTDRVEMARKKLYRDMTSHIKLFTEAFDRIIEEKNDVDINSMLDRTGLEDILDEAEKLYSSGQVAEANQTLKQAADMLEIALSDARHQDVLLHELDFATLEEEYIYEVKRNDSYIMLIRMIQQKTGISDASREYIETVINRNVGIKQDASRFAGDGNMTGAIKVLEKGTDNLSRALRMSGVAF